VVANVAATVGILFAFLIFIETSFTIGSRIFVWLTRMLGLYVVQVGIFFAVVSIGVFAHWFKNKNQKWYGWVEVLFGAASSISISFRITPGQSLFAQWVALAGCVYVIARGLNNIADANSKSRAQLKV
jgi:hypothetical protein